MKVRDLINHLEKFNDDLQVCYPDDLDRMEALPIRSIGVKVLSDGKSVVLMNDMNPEYRNLIENKIS